jgi:hypothetical protein
LTNLIYFPLLKIVVDAKRQFGCAGFYAPGSMRVVLDEDTKAFVGVMEHPGKTGCPEGHKGCFKPCTVYTSVKPTATGITGNENAVLSQIDTPVPTPAASRASVSNGNGQYPMQVDADVKG